LPFAICTLLFATCSLLSALKSQASRLKPQKNPPPAPSCKREGSVQAVSRVLSAGVVSDLHLTGAVGPSLAYGYFSASAVARALKRSTRHPSARTERPVAAAQVPKRRCDDCVTLHEAGFAVPSRSRVTRWALTPPFHPCLSRRPPLPQSGLSGYPLSPRGGSSAIGGLFSVALSLGPNPGPGGRYPPPCSAVLGLSSVRALARQQPYACNGGG
jgi:hypothetical protein